MPIEKNAERYFARQVRRTVRKAERSKIGREIQQKHIALLNRVALFKEDMKKIDIAQAARADKILGNLKQGEIDPFFKRKNLLRTIATFENLNAFRRGIIKKFEKELNQLREYAKKRGFSALIEVDDNFWGFERHLNKLAASDKRLASIKQRL